jgi:hypothetical protein
LLMQPPVQGHLLRAPGGRGHLGPGQLLAGTDPAADHQFGAAGRAARNDLDQAAGNRLPYRDGGDRIHVGRVKLTALQCLDLTSVTDFNGNKISITNTADGLASAQSLASTGDTISTNYDNADNPSCFALSCAAVSGRF